MVYEEKPVYYIDPEFTQLRKVLVLVCSRPTAVNLSEAATKLKEVLHKATSTASDAQTVYQVRHNGLWLCGPDNQIPLNCSIAHVFM